MTSSQISTFLDDLDLRMTDLFYNIYTQTNEGGWNTAEVNFISVHDTMDHFNDLVVGTNLSPRASDD